MKNILYLREYHVEHVKEKTVDKGLSLQYIKILNLMKMLGVSQDILILTIKTLTYKKKL